MSDRLQKLFVQNGLHYYVAARYATFAQLAPVCGNLFHHAVENLLKAHLCARVSTKELQRKLGHDLQLAWRMYKQSVGDPSLDQFDLAISDLDQFEDIRYSDQIAGKGLRLIVSEEYRQPPEVLRPMAARSPGGEAAIPPEPLYQIVLSEMDQVVAAILAHCPPYPAYVIDSLSPDAREFFYRRNQCRLATQSNN